MAAVNSPEQSKMTPLDFVILVIPPLFWAGNFVLGRAIHAEIPPITLSFGRWVMALCVLLPFAWKVIKRDWDIYWDNKWRILGASIFGVTAFNALIYIGLHTTTATNGVLINSLSPMLIVFLGMIFYHQKIKPLQGVGLLLSLFGVAAIVLKGDYQNLLSLSFTKGDIIILIAVFCWAIYTLWLRQLPKEMNKVGLTALQFIIAVVTLLPFFIFEYASGARIIWTPLSILAFIYIGVFPSVIAFLLYTLGVSRMGAARAGLFIHLMPVFGAVLSMLFLNEALYAYHYIGMAIIFLGIALFTVQPKYS